jgi:hypothetical protein
MEGIGGSLKESSADQKGGHRKPQGGFQLAVSPFMFIGFI